jgi:outer membrane receptor protein involved in Fe transport
MKTNRTLVFALFAATATWPSLLAQTAAPAAATPAAPQDEEVLQLSPFEVVAEEDTGYVATSTLAGTRIRTDLRDVGAAISVITKEFMQDIGATDTGTLLQYTTNAEVAGTRGTYAGLGNGTSVDESGNLAAPGGAQRVRGLAAADNTRDFYVTDIPWDGYNVDRIDIQRGPNSILFGLGSPAGIVNASLRNAEFRNRGSVEVRTGSYGSMRGVLDVNRELIDDVLAIRVSGLWDHEKFRQDPAFEDDERVYAAVRFEPKLFKRDDFRTSIKVKYEKGDITANRPRTVTPNDNLTAWFRPKAITADNPFGGMGKEVANNAYDPWRSDVANITAGDGRGMGQSTTVNYQPWLRNIPNQQQPFWTIDGASNQTYRVFGGWVNTGARNNTGGTTGSAVGVLGKRTNDMFYGVNSLPGAAIGLRLPNAQYGQYRQQSLLDPTIFDYNHNLIDGPNKWEEENWDAYNVSLSQTGWGDRVGLEFNYDRQIYKRSNGGFFGGAPALSVDVLKNFADYYTNANADGLTSVTNPNFGRPFVSSEAGGSGSSYRSDREYSRASVFGELRSKDFFQGEFLTKLLGKHRFNGVYSGEEFFTESRAWVENAFNQQWAGFWNGNSGSGSSFRDRAPLAFVYVGPSVANLSSASGAYIPRVDSVITMADPAIRIFNANWTGGTNYSDPWNVPASLYTVFNGLPNPQSTAQLTQASNPANYTGWSDYVTDLLRYNNGADTSLTTRAQKSLRETTSYAGSWQGFLWNDAIVATLGWRYDEVKGKAVNALPVGGNRSIYNLDPAVYKLPDAYPASQIFKDHSTSGGVVVHLNRLFTTDRLPLNVSVSYNKSSNFQVTDTRRDIYGNPIANPTGSTKDYGVLLATKDGKYSFRAVKFETSVMGASSGLSDAAGIGRVIAQGLRFRNVFLYKLGVYDWNTRDQWGNRNTWGATDNPLNPGNTIGADRTLTAAQGRTLEDAAITTWNQIQADLTAKGFFDAWGFQPQALSSLTTRTAYEANPGAFVPPDTTRVFAYSATPPAGFTVTADTQSEGYEFEFTANPLPNWRIAFNASETTATRSNVGGELLEDYIAYLDEKLTGTPAGNMPQFGNTGLSIYANVYGPWRSNYVLMKLQEGAAAPEIRKWRYNVVTNYTFREGLLKNVNVGGSYRWQDKVVIGYPVVTGGSFDLTQPYYGPSEDAIDLWAGYERKISDKLNWKVQLNIRNAFAKDGLIPISVQPDGNTWASVRVKPNQEWFLTNTFSF